MTAVSRGSSRQRRSISSGAIRSAPGTATSSSSHTPEATTSSTIASRASSNRFASLGLMRRSSAIAPSLCRLTRLAARRSLSRAHRRGHLDQLALDRDLDLLANDEPVVGDHVERHPEVAAHDLAFGRVADSVAHLVVAHLAE